MKTQSINRAKYRWDIDVSSVDRNFSYCCIGNYWRIRLSKAHPQCGRRPAESKAAALTTHLDERFAKNANPELSGDSLKDFNQLKDEYQDEFLTAASRVDDLADQIAQDLHGFNLLKVKPDLRKLQDATAKLLSEQTNLEEGLKN